MPVQIYTPFKSVEHAVPVEQPVAVSTSQGVQGPQGFQGPQGYQGTQGPQGGFADGLPVSGLCALHANEYVPAYELITFGGMRADSSNSNHFGAVAGITLDDAWPGTDVVICFYGVVTNPSWNWTGSNRCVFLVGQKIVENPPVQGWNQLVGKTMAATSVFMRLSEPVLL